MGHQLESFLGSPACQPCTISFGGTVPGSGVGSLTATPSSGLPLAYWDDTPYQHAFDPHTYCVADNIGPISYWKYYSPVCDPRHERCANKYGIRRHLFFDRKSFAVCSFSIVKLQLIKLLLSYGHWFFWSIIATNLFIFSVLNFIWYSRNKRSICLEPQRHLTNIKCAVPNRELHHDAKTNRDNPRHRELWSTIKSFNINPELSFLSICKFYHHCRSFGNKPDTRDREFTDCAVTWNIKWNSTSRVDWKRNGVISLEQFDWSNKRTIRNRLNVWHRKRDLHSVDEYHSLNLGDRNCHNCIIERNCTVRSCIFSHWHLVCAISADKHICFVPGPKLAWD
ncbi:hypothetical protein QC762_0020440 [Podospora pseudocomata]|uniref:Uncharacterized protein n=1 Tax=Podospora pseudocomata TaxID=2093779 RepID=A0ABR0GY88_9PEZI|nr:hypothetical protein QC762_0020440 [Podospora pseudocomata]